MPDPEIKCNLIARLYKNIEDNRSRSQSTMLNVYRIVGSIIRDDGIKAEFGKGTEIVRSLKKDKALFEDLKIFIANSDNVCANCKHNRYYHTDRTGECHSETSYLKKPCDKKCVQFIKKPL